MFQIVSSMWTFVRVKHTGGTRPTVICDGL